MAPSVMALISCCEKYAMPMLVSPYRPTMVPTELASHQCRKDGLQIADHIPAGVDAIYSVAMSTPSYDVIVIGAGPAGLTAATEAARAGLSALCLDKLAPGGQLINLGTL